MLSVIVPVYNSSKYLAECVESILSQDYKNIEVLLIDDGSTDSSGRICDDYARLDSRVKVFHILNRGVGNARNVGISHAAGAYITFVDSDDYISKNIYKDNITLLEQDSKLDFIQVPIRNRKKNRGVIEGTRNLFDSWILKEKVITNYFWDKIFRISLFSELKFPIGMSFEDRCLFPDLLNIVNKIYVSDIGWYHYRSHPGQTTRNLTDKSKKDMFLANINMLKKIPSTCKTCQVRCFWDTMILIKEMSKKKILKDETFDVIQKMFPSFSNIWTSNVPFGVKVQLTSMFVKFRIAL